MQKEPPTHNNDLGPHGARREEATHIVRQNVWCRALAICKIRNSMYTMTHERFPIEESDLIYHLFMI